MKVNIPLLRAGKSFSAQLLEDGILVSNLGVQPFLPQTVFVETVSLLKENGGRARKGDAMNCKLGDKGLELNTIEGHVANVVYGTRIGKSVFRRISPITGILIWSGICENKKGELILSAEIHSNS